MSHKSSTVSLSWRQPRTSLDTPIVQQHPIEHQSKETSGSLNSLTTSVGSNEKKKTLLSDKEEDLDSCSMSLPTAQPIDDWLVHVDRERTRDICCQSMGPFLLAGLGSIGAGLLLHYAQNMDLLENVPQIVAIAPPLQGLKGNLDLTFTSRLTTMAHKGGLDERDGRILHIFRNMAAIQSQSLLLSLFITLFCFLLNLANRLSAGHQAPVKEFLFLGAISIAAMGLACAVMSIIMVLIVLYARKNRVNPDNIATPLASSMGDLMTVGLMLGFGYLVYDIMQTNVMIPISCLLVGAATFPVWMYIASKDAGSWKAVKTQWFTLIFAAVFSSLAGLIQEIAFKLYPELTAYLPLITGIAGNRAALQASRISSHLNVGNKNPLSWPVRLNPWRYYVNSESESTLARLLLFTAIPYQAIFVFVSHGIAQFTACPLKLNGWFVLGYLITAFIQVSVLLFITQLVVNSLWQLGIDPDMHAIPILTSIGDLIGAGLIFLLFYICAQFDDVVRVVHDASLNGNSTNITC